MRRIAYLIIICAFCNVAQAQHTFKGTSLSEALIELDNSSKHYDISFVYDELEDFTVSKTIKRGCSLPEAVREVCGFYPVRVSVKGRDILVECIQKDRTKLRGRLVGPDRQPVSYANITLYPSTDSTYLGGGVSNEAGDFVIPCGAERARVRISCVGFKTIERVMTIGDAGTIRMQMENNYLSDVTVSGRLSVIRSEAGRLQYIVSNDEFAKGHNAQELLNRVPMVSMAGGRAMILGKGPARFMLNGRITEMDDEAIQQRLWAMRSEDIDRIEVISIPSGRDMIEMGGGYINIVMRRDQTLGWRGDISAEAGMNDDWNGRGSGSVSYASEKFDMTIDAHGGRTTQKTDNLMDYYVTDEYNVLSDTHSKQTDKETATNLTFRYQPVKDLELGGMLSWLMRWPEKTTDGILTYAGMQSESVAEQTPDKNTSVKSLIAYCDWRLDTKGKLLSLTYNNYKKDDDTRTGVFYNNPLMAIPNTKIWNGYRIEVDYHIQSGRLDLTMPFNNMTIDAGASYTSIKNLGHRQEKQDDNSIIFYEDGTYNYQEKRKAAYISLHHEWDKYSIRAGLHYKHIGLDRDYLQKDLFSRDYWLPSLNVSVKPKEGQQINLTWGTDCVNPNFYDLNALNIYKTGYESFKGDPTLQPSRTSNIELSYHNHKGFYACAYHHHVSNTVERCTQVTFLRTNQLSSLGEENAPFLYYAYSFPVNRGRINQFGLYLRYQYQFTSSLLATAEGDASYHDFKTTQTIQENVPKLFYIQNLYGWRERLSLSADWYMNRQHTLLLNARYQHWFSDCTGMTKTDGYGYFCFALRYSMMDDRLRLSLVANDPFHQQVTDETVYSGWAITPGFGSVKTPDYLTQFSHTNHHTHYIGLTATYSFGGKKVRRIQHDMKDTESQRAEIQKK